MYENQNSNTTPKVLFSNKKNPSNLDKYNKFIFELNKRYQNPNNSNINKISYKSLITGLSNLDINLNNLNSEFNYHKKNNSKQKINPKSMLLYQDINNDNNNNSSLYFHMNLNMKDNFNSINSSDKHQKNPTRNLSIISNNKKSNIQRNSLRKEPSFINRILYNHNNNNANNLYKENTLKNKNANNIYNEISYNNHNNIPRNNQKNVNKIKSFKYQYSLLSNNNKNFTQNYSCGTNNFFQIGKLKKYVTKKNTQKYFQNTKKIISDGNIKTDSYNLNNLNYMYTNTNNNISNQKAIHRKSNSKNEKSCPKFNNNNGYTVNLSKYNTKNNIKSFAPTVSFQQNITINKKISDNIDKYLKKNHQQNYDPPQYNFQNLYNVKINTTFQKNSNDLNNYRLTTQVNNNKNKLLVFKKLNTVNYLNNNNNYNCIKNFVVNSEYNSNPTNNIGNNINSNIQKMYSNILKKKRPRQFDSGIKSYLVESNSVKYLNKSNNNNINNNISNKIFNNSNKILNAKNNTNTKGRNEKYNLGVIFKPQILSKKMNTNRNSINSTSNNLNLNQKESNSMTITQQPNIKNNFFAKIKKLQNQTGLISNISDTNSKSNENKNLDKSNLLNLMKTVDEYNNKNKLCRNDSTQKLKNSFIGNFSEFALVNEIDEKKTNQSISKNTLTMYTIYILSHYYIEFTKIGLLRIQLFNKNNEQIPVICSNSNNNIDTKRLFDLQPFESTNGYRPFIADFNKKIFINFFINNTNEVEYLKIINYTNLKNHISPVKKIEIYKKNLLIYKGVLNQNIANKIILSDTPRINNIPNNIPNNNIPIKNSNNNNISRPFSSGKSRINDENINNNNENYSQKKNALANYFTTRGITANSNLLKNKENYENELINSNNNTVNSIKKQNTINLNINNNSNNISNNKLGIYNDNMQTSLINNKDRYLISNIDNSNLNTNDENNNLFGDLMRKTFNKNDSKCFDKILKTSLSKVREYNSFKLTTNNNNNFLNDFDELDINSINEYNYSNYNNNNENYEISNFIEFNKIRFVISSNYGHHKYVGLTGIEFYNLKSEQINIETALTIGALPKDLRTLYNDEKENRIFENVFNKINNTNDPDNMWCTKFKKHSQLPYIELYFEEKIRLSKIKIYNYNERDKLNIGAKTIELYLDDVFYNTINLKMGIGEIAFDFMKNFSASQLDDSDENENLDFGQDITFPINENNEMSNNDLFFKNTFNSFNSIDSINKKKCSFDGNFFDWTGGSNININNNICNSHCAIETNMNILGKNNKKLNFASNIFKQCYETPYMPCGFCIKFEFNTNYYKGVAPKEEADLLKYNDIGLNDIEIFNEDGVNILTEKLKNSQEMENYYKYKILANCEIFHETSKIIINGTQNENSNNCLFYIFEKPIKISYIKFYPLEELNSVKDMKIFIDSKIVFEGTLYFNKPTIVLFTCDEKIIQNIDANYLTKEINVRELKEEKTENYISLIMN